MKLYTEEQVKYLIHMLVEDMNDFEFSKIMEEYSLTPIELPSDEEIKVEAQSQWGNVHRTGILGFINCARWMKNQILNQNK